MQFKADEMEMADRIKRDGDRWRYVWLLERQAEIGGKRRSVMISSLLLNCFLVVVLAALLAL